MERLLGTLMLGVLTASSAWAQSAPELTKFDSFDLELRRVDDHWQVRGGTAFVKDLGTSENDAREAVRLIRDLRLTQHGTVGSPQPVIEYWLADGQPPQGIVPRRLSSIDLKTLQVCQLQGHWCLRDARQVLFNFGPHEQDAGQALAVLQRYQFNRVGYVGAGEPVMMYFMSGADDTRGGAVTNDPRPMRPLTADQLYQPRQLTPPSPFVYDPATGGERLALDWRQVQLRHDGLRTKLVQGNQCLADFGSNEMDAREAQRIVQYYRFTEQCRIGPTFSFFLVNGQAPHGLGMGVRSTSFHLQQLNIRQIDGRWMLVEGDRPLLPAGSNATEAKQVLAIIQKYQFDNLCWVGRADAPAMSFLVQGR